MTTATRTALAAAVFDVPGRAFRAPFVATAVRLGDGAPVPADEVAAFRRRLVGRFVDAASPRQVEALFTVAAAFDDYLADRYDAPCPPLTRRDPR
jgi:hypothetical protein